MATSFLYWNINKRINFENEIATLANNVDINADVLLLIEASRVNDIELERLTGLKRLKVIGESETDLTPRFYSKLPFDEFQILEVHYTHRIVFVRLNKKKSEEIILGGVHLPSKLETNTKTQYKDARQVAADLKTMKERKDINHNRFVLFGDFNMNPFEDGMIEPDAFNAVISSNLSKKEKRTDWYKKFDYFYNPMWSFFGDRNYLTGEEKTPGTYFLSKTRDTTLTYWNMFDKVIMRPGIIDLFDFTSLKIIDNNGNESFINSDFSIKKRKFSDHLPITFKLKI